MPSLWKMKVIVTKSFFILKMLSILLAENNCQYVINSDVTNSDVFSTERKKRPHLALPKKSQKAVSIWQNIGLFHHNSTMTVPPVCTLILEGNCIEIMSSIESDNLFFRDYYNFGTKMRILDID